MRLQIPATKKPKPYLPSSIFLTFTARIWIQKGGFYFQMFTPFLYIFHKPTRVITIKPLYASVISVVMAFVLKNSVQFGISRTHY